MILLSPQQIAARTLTISFFFIILCAHASDRPDCPAPPAKTSELSANAGCLVTDNDAILVIQDIKGRVSIPGGGAERGEPAACTAFRETWEETSVVTLPVSIAAEWPNGFVMFQCDMKSKRSEAKVRRPLEVRNVLWLKPDQFNDYRWRFPKQKSWLKNWLLEQINKQ